jgi:signal transduction histidine kinase
MAPPDPLTELRERVHAAQAAAERLAGEARTQARELPHESRDELDALVGLLRALRELVPPELQQQVSEVIRHVLLLLRALIDYWVDRLDAPRPAEVDVQDIPIA